MYTLRDLMDDAKQLFPFQIRIRAQVTIAPPFQNAGLSRLFVHEEAFSIE